MSSILTYQKYMNTLPENIHIVWLPDTTVTNTNVCLLQYVTSFHQTTTPTNLHHLKREEYWGPDLQESCNQCICTIVAAMS